MPIRQAQKDQSQALLDIAMASKAHWGYGAEFMARCRDELAVPEAAFDTQGVFSLYEGETIVGFYCLRTDQEHPELTHMFLDPAAMGKGHGRALWDHLLEQVRDRGLPELYIIADPNAAPFYAHVGAVKVGEVESPAEKGRMIPLMRYEVS